VVGAVYGGDVVLDLLSLLRSVSSLQLSLSSHQEDPEKEEPAKGKVSLYQAALVLLSVLLQVLNLPRAIAYLLPCRRKGAL